MLKKDVKYEIVEVMGVASKQADLKSDWVKAVLKTLWNDTESGIGINRFNVSTNQIGSGIRLTEEEAHNLADLLISNGYGSMEVLEKEYKRRTDLYGGESK